MEYRTLGRSGIRVAPLAFGGNVFGWTIDEPTSFSLLDHFHASGFNFIDTADVYSNWVPGNSGGESETIIGKWLKKNKNRKDMIIATKGGSSMIRGGAKNLSYSYLISAAEKSLKRLQTDYIDLYQSHYDDLNTAPEETLKAYQKLVEQGKVKWIGASNFSRERLEKSLRVSEEFGMPGYICVQPGYNLYDRQQFETELAQTCAENNLAVIPYYSLASGFLSGKYRSETDLSKSQRGAGIKKYLDERGLKILQALDQVSAKYTVSAAVIALSWLLSRPNITAPIASATSIEQLDQLMLAPGINLDDDDLELLNRSSSYA